METTNVGHKLMISFYSQRLRLSIARVRGDYEVLMEINLYVQIFTSDCIFSYQIAHAAVLLYVKIKWT